MGASENILRDLSQGLLPTNEEYAKEIHVAAERLNRLVANLLDMTRLESGMIQPKLDWHDVRDVINSALKGLDKELSGHHVTVNVDEDMPLVKLDYGLIEQAITNLVHNATVHSPDETEIQVSATHTESECIIDVSDSGPGLTSDEIQKVFEKFYRAPTAKTGGTGLGLPIAKGFVEAHRGTISAKNSPNGGAEFIVKIPIDPEAGKSKQEKH